MCLNFQNNLSSSTHFNYLSNCDLINKYNLTSVHHIPKLDKINLELNIWLEKMILNKPEQWIWTHNRWKQ